MYFFLVLLVLLSQEKATSKPIWWYQIFWMYWSPSCSSHFAWLSAAAGSLDQADQTSKDIEQVDKQATRAASLVHQSLKRSDPSSRATICGFPWQKLFPVACPVLWGHGCCWKMMWFCCGTLSQWPPSAKRLEGKLCWSCGPHPTHTW